MVPGYNCGSHAFLKTQTSLILHSALACFLHLRDLGSIPQRLEAELGNHTPGLKCQELRALVKFIDL